jgi:hypothetical protein
MSLPLSFFMSKVNEGYTCHLSDTLETIVKTVLFRNQFLEIIVKTVFIKNSMYSNRTMRSFVAFFRLCKLPWHGSFSRGDKQVCIISSFHKLLHTPFRS